MRRVSLIATIIALFLLGCGGSDDGNYMISSSDEPKITFEGGVVVYRGFENEGDVYGAEVNVSTSNLATQSFVDGDSGAPLGNVSFSLDKAGITTATIKVNIDASSADANLTGYAYIESAEVGAESAVVDCTASGGGTRIGGSASTSLDINIVFNDEEEERYLTILACSDNGAGEEVKSQADVIIYAGTEEFKPNHRLSASVSYSTNVMSSNGDVLVGDDLRWGVSGCENKGVLEYTGGGVDSFVRKEKFSNGFFQDKKDIIVPYDCDTVRITHSIGAMAEMGKINSNGEREIVRIKKLSSNGVITGRTNK